MAPFKDWQKTSQCNYETWESSTMDALCGTLDGELRYEPIASHHG
jgi:hypothetical protein